MIVESVAEFERVLAELNDLRNQERRLENVRETDKGLTKVNQQLEHLEEGYSHVIDLLPNRELLAEYLGEIIKVAEKSQEQFERDIRQTRTLEDISGRIKQFTNLTIDEWLHFRDAAIRQRRERLKLVRGLPELQERRGTIRRFEKQLTQTEGMLGLPEDDEALGQFLEALTRLDEIFANANLDNLPDNVQAFLEKVREKTATFADIDEEILDWCRASNRDTAFQIVFFGQ